MSGRHRRAAGPAWPRRCPAGYHRRARRPARRLRRRRLRRRLRRRPHLAAPPGPGLPGRARGAAHRGRAPRSSPPSRWPGPSTSSPPAASCAVVDEPDRFGFGTGPSRSTRRAARRPSSWRGPRRARSRVEVVRPSPALATRSCASAAPWPAASRPGDGGLHRGARPARARHLRRERGTSGGARPGGRGTSRSIEHRKRLCSTGCARVVASAAMGVRAMEMVSADQAVAFRVAAHNLHERLPADGPPRRRRRGRGAGHPARQRGCRPGRPRREADARARSRRRCTTTARCCACWPARRRPRGAPRRRRRVRPGCAGGRRGLAARAARRRAGPPSTRPGWTAREALGSVIGVLAAVLADAEPRTKGQLSEALHGRVPARARAVVRRVRRPPRARPAAAPGRHRRRVLLRLAPGAAGRCSWPPTSGWASRWAATWPAARLELARRFVHAYGPVLPRHFAAWTGIAPAEARDRFLTARRRARRREARRGDGGGAAGRPRHAGRPAAGDRRRGCCPPATRSSPSATGRRCWPTRPASGPCGARSAAPGWC